MSELVIHAKALDQIKHIHEKSRTYNQKIEKVHQERLLELMRKHMGEIEDLAKQKDPHCLIETGDLLILCFELLLENKASIDEILLRCFDRYENKLSQLIDEAEDTTTLP